MGEDFYDGGDEGGGDGGVLVGLVVEGAVGFYVVEVGVDVEDALELAEGEGADFLGGVGDGFSAEVFWVFVAGVGADGDLGLESELDGVADGGWGAGVAAAGDVDGGDEGDEGGIVE